MLTLETYLMGRDQTHAAELTDEILGNARLTVAKANELLGRAGRSDIDKPSSGWRPGSVNSRTAGSAVASRHITGQAVDISDVDRTLAEWCVDNLDALEDIGLFLEDPRWTPTWVHVQTVPPKSGKLVFIPSSAKPLDPDFPVTWA